MARPKKKEEEKRIRIDITITKDEAAKLEEISRITGIPKSWIVSKMINEESLEEAIQYARWKKQYLTSSYNRYKVNKTAGESGQPAEAIVDSATPENIITGYQLEDKEIDEVIDDQQRKKWDDDIEATRKIALQKWGGLKNKAL